MISRVCLFLSLFMVFASAELIKVPTHYYPCSLLFKEHLNDYPFPTEMTFRTYCDHSIDPSTEYFDPSVVQKGDTIFLSDWYMPWFAVEVHPKIQHPYILISNDTDGWHPKIDFWNGNPQHNYPASVVPTRVFLYDSKVAAWFCKNMIFSRHPKIFQIPIGQNINYWGRFPEKDYLLSLREKKEHDKPFLLYLNMQLNSHPSRPGIAQLFQDKPYCVSRIDSLKQQVILRNQFYDELSLAQFTPAPPGYGPDTVRFWEAIVLDCIPIVKHCELDDLYSDLPVLFVHEWEEVNQELLCKQAAKIQSKKISKDKAYFDYWARKISQVQKKVREDSNDFSKLEATLFVPQDLADLTTVLKQHTTFGDCLLCTGAALGLRAYEIVRDCPFFSWFFVQDEWGAWGHEYAAAHLSNFSNHPLLLYNHKILTTNFDVDLFSSCNRNSGYKMHVFFDLSYVRANLKKDLENAYTKSMPDVLICGNLGNDPFVDEVLQRFASKFGISIEKRGTIWFLKV